MRVIYLIASEKFIDSKYQSLQIDRVVNCYHLGMNLALAHERLQNNWLDIDVRLDNKCYQLHTIWLPTVIHFRAAKIRDTTSLQLLLHQIGLFLLCDNAALIVQQKEQRICTVFTAIRGCIHLSKPWRIPLSFRHAPLMSTRDRYS